MLSSAGSSNLWPQDFLLRGPQELLLWKDEEHLYVTRSAPKNTVQEYEFQQHPDCYSIVAIKKQYIVALAREGDIHYVSNVKGSGGGTNVAGAVRGAFWGGAAGAIIGSREEIKIETTTEQVDDRCTKLQFLDGENRYAEWSFSYQEYFALAKLLEIPVAQ